MDHIDYTIWAHYSLDLKNDDVLWHRFGETEILKES
jgi:hypothetical protein